MPPPYGVDTQTSRLDRIPWPAFLAWNGDTGPVFAGCNFLGGDFIWVSPEATTALATPSPTDPTFLEMTTDYIAPFQAKDSTRQKVNGDLGRLYGQIDGTALCAQISATMNTKELTPDDPNIVYVYLEIDPSAAFSVDYWAGWSHAVYDANITPGQFHNDPPLHPSPLVNRLSVRPIPSPMRAPSVVRRCCRAVVRARERDGEGSGTICRRLTLEIEGKSICAWGGPFGRWLPKRPWC